MAAGSVVATAIELVAAWSFARPMYGAAAASDLVALLVPPENVCQSHKDSTLLARCAEETPGESAGCRVAGMRLLRFGKIIHRHTKGFGNGQCWAEADPGTSPFKSDEKAHITRDQAGKLFAAHSLGLP